MCVGLVHDSYVQAQNRLAGIGSPSTVWVSGIAHKHLYPLNSSSTCPCLLFNGSLTIPPPHEGLGIWIAEVLNSCHFQYFQAGDPSLFPKESQPDFFHHCGSLNVIDLHKLTWSGTLRRCGLAGVGVVLLEEVHHCGGGL